MHYKYLVYVYIYLYFIICFVYEYRYIYINISFIYCVSILQKHSYFKLHTGVLTLHVFLICRYHSCPVCISPLTRSESKRTHARKCTTCDARLALIFGIFHPTNLEIVIVPLTDMNKTTCFYRIKTYDILIINY